MAKNPRHEPRFPRPGTANDAETAFAANFLRHEHPIRRPDHHQAGKTAFMAKNPRHECPIRRPTQEKSSKPPLMANFPRHEPRFSRPGHGERPKTPFAANFPRHEGRVTCVGDHTKAGRAGAIWLCTRKHPRWGGSEPDMVKTGAIKQHRETINRARKRTQNNCYSFINKHIPLNIAHSIKYKQKSYSHERFTTIKRTNQPMQRTQNATKPSKTEQKQTPHTKPPHPTLTTAQNLFDYRPQHNAQHQPRIISRVSRCERAGQIDRNTSNRNASGIQAKRKPRKIGALVELAGFEPATLCLQSRCATSCAIAPNALRYAKWAREDLNLRPHPYQGCALTT